MRRIQICLDEAVWQRLKQLSEGEEGSMSAVVRAALDRYLDEQERARRPLAPAPPSGWEHGRRTRHRTSPRCGVSWRNARAGRGGDHPAVEQLIADFVVLPLDLEAAELGGRLRRRYGPSHGTGLVDALLAAMAITRRLTLVTDNRRHFPMRGLDLG